MEPPLRSTPCQPGSAESAGETGHVNFLARQKLAPIPLDLFILVEPQCMPTNLTCDHCLGYHFKEPDKTW